MIKRLRKSWTLYYDRFNNINIREWIVTSVIVFSFMVLILLSKNKNIYTVTLILLCLSRLTELVCRVLYINNIEGKDWLRFPIMIFGHITFLLLNHLFVNGNIKREFAVIIFIGLICIADTWYLCIDTKIRNSNQ